MLSVLQRSETYATVVNFLCIKHGPHLPEVRVVVGGYPVTAWRTTCLYGVTYNWASPRLPDDGISSVSDTVWKSWLSLKMSSFYLLYCVFLKERAVAVTDSYCHDSCLFILQGIFYNILRGYTWYWSNTLPVICRLFSWCLCGQNTVLRIFGVLLQRFES